jgi:hypothetical protein
MKQNTKDVPLPVALRYLFVSKRAEEELEKRRQNKGEFVVELLRFLHEKWPTQGSLLKSGRVVAYCRGAVGEHLKFVVEPELRATAVYLADEPEPTTDKIRELIAANVAVESPFV